MSGSAKKRREKYRNRARRKRARERKRERTLCFAYLAFAETLATQALSQREPQYMNSLRKMEEYDSLHPR